MSRRCLSADSNSRDGTLVIPASVGQGVRGRAASRRASSTERLLEGTKMNKLQLSIAVGHYDRIRPLVDGEVQIEGVDPVYMTQEPEEIFFRAFRHADYDVCELSL